MTAPGCRLIDRVAQAVGVRQARGGADAKQLATPRHPPGVQVATAAVTVALLCGLTTCMPAPATLLNHASALYRSGRYAEAAAEYRQVVAQAPSWWAPYLGIGNCERRLGHSVAALTAYSTAATLSPGNSDVQLALGTLLLEMEMWDLATERLQKAVASCGPDPRIEALLGHSLAKQGRRLEALGAFRKSLTVCPDCLTSVEASLYALLVSEEQ
jgi:tetratricopeptide (TPR) repeat protein